MLHFTNRGIIETLLTVHVLYCFYMACFHFRIVKFIEGINRYDITKDNPLMLEFSMKPKWMGGKRLRDLTEAKQATVIKAAEKLKAQHDELISTMNPKFVDKGLVALMFVADFFAFSYAMDLKSFVSKLFSKNQVNI